MKHWLFLSFTLVFLSACQSNTAPSAKNTAEEDTNQQSSITENNEASFDAALAEKLGADEYGMSVYVMAFLKEGPNKTLSAEESSELQSAHMANIGRLADEGKLMLAGPFLDKGPLRGIYIFDVESIEEAKALTNSDPAIQAGILEMELHPWYGSAAIKEINELHNRIQKIKI
jgi:uncharacterized protein YciI